MRQREAGPGRRETRGNAGIELRRQRRLLHGLGFAFEIAEAVRHLLDHRLQRRQRLAVAIVGRAQIFVDAGNRLFDGLGRLHRQLFVVFEALRHLFETLRQRLRNFVALHIVEVFELARDAADARLESLDRFLGTMFGLLQPPRHLLKARLEPVDGGALVFGLRLLLDGFQRGFHGLRADAGDAVLHLFHARRKLHQRIFERACPFLGFLALGFLFRRFDAVRKRSQRLADFAQRFVGAPLGRVEMIDDRIDGFFERLDRARILGAQTAARSLGALHAFVKLLQFPVERIQRSRIGNPGLGISVVHVVLRLVDALGELSHRRFEPARHFRGAAFAVLDPLHHLAHRLGHGGEIDPGHRFRLGRRRLRRGLGRRRIGVPVGSGTGAVGAHFVRACIHDDLVQPRAERHARPPGSLLGRLARLGLNALDAPWNPRSHPNHYAR